jgi:hypothetical protein
MIWCLIQKRYRSQRMTGCCIVTPPAPVTQEEEALELDEARSADPSPL